MGLFTIIIFDQCELIGLLTFGLHFFQHLFPCAFRTDDLIFILNKSFSHHGSFAHGTNKAFVMPSQLFESNEFGVSKASFTGDGFGTSCTTFGKEFSKTLCAIRFVISGSKALSSQGFGAMSASETFTMPRIIAVGYTTLCNNLVAFDTLCGKLVFVTLGTVDVMLFGNKRFGSDGVFTNAANEAFLVPLPRLVLHFLHACSEYIATSITTRGKLSIVARSTVDPIGFGTKLLVN